MDLIIAVYFFLLALFVVTFLTSPVQKQIHLNSADRIPSHFVTPTHCVKNESLSNYLTEYHSVIRL